MKSEKALETLTEIAYGRGARPENNLESRIILENLQALEIIITRAIDIFTLMWCFYNHKTYEDYMANKNAYSGNPDIEEFTLLMEVLKDEN